MTTEELIRTLREKESRDNRKLLDEAADQLELAVKSLIALTEELSSVRASNQEVNDLLVKTIYSKNTEIKILQKRYDLAVAEREANVRAFMKTLEKMRRDGDEG